MRRERKPASLTKRLQWRLEWFVYLCLETALARVPVSTVFHIGEKLGALAWHLFPARRRIVIRNLRIAFANEKSRPEIEHLARENFRRTGANLVCAARTARMTRTEFREVLRVEGLENIPRVISGEGGVVVLIPHMGNWEALSRLHLAMPDGVKLAAYYRPLNNPLMDARVLKRREADGTRMFSKADNPLKSAAVLKEPVCLGILADVRTGMAGEETTFFGRFTRASQLPSLIARRAKAPVAALSMRTEAPGKWVVSFHPVENPPHVGNCMAAIETAMRHSPADVFWMQDRWKLFLRQGPAAWFTHVPESAVKKHRGVIWMDRETQLPPAEWFHPNITWLILANPGKPFEIPSGAELRTIAPQTDPATELAAIDHAAALPLDLVISRKPLPALRTAARNLGIAYLAWDVCQQPSDQSIPSFPEFCTNRRP